MITENKSISYIAYISCAQYGQRQLIRAARSMDDMMKNLANAGFSQDAKEEYGYVVDTDTVKTEKIYKLPDDCKLNLMYHGNYCIIFSITDFVNDVNTIIEAFEDLRQCNYHVIDSDGDE